MYHPELYPEFAKKNGYIAPLVINRKDKILLNKAEIENNMDNQNKNINNNINNENNNFQFYDESQLKVVETENVISANKNEAKEKFPNFPHSKSSS